MTVSHVISGSLMGREAEKGQVPCLRPQCAGGRIPLSCLIPGPLATLLGSSVLQVPTRLNTLGLSGLAADHISRPSEPVGSEAASFSP